MSCRALPLPCLALPCLALSLSCDFLGIVLWLAYDCIVLPFLVLSCDVSRLALPCDSFVMSCGCRFLCISQSVSLAHISSGIPFLIGNQRTIIWLLSKRSLVLSSLVLYLVIGLSCLVFGWVFSLSCLVLSCDCLVGVCTCHCLVLWLSCPVLRSFDY